MQRSKTERRSVGLSWYRVSPRGRAMLLAGLKEEEIPSQYQLSGYTGAVASQGRAKVKFFSLRCSD